MSHIEEGRLHAYLDGECADREIEQIEAHVAVCDTCQDRLAAAMAATQAASEILAEVEPGPVSAPGWRELEERAAARARKGPHRVWARPSLAWAAVIAIAFGLGWFTNTYWSRASLAPDSGYRQADAPVTAAKALEPEPSPQAPAVAVPSPELGEQSAESKIADERALRDSRAKTADELPAAAPPAGRRVAAEGEVDKVGREETFAAAKERLQSNENLARTVTEETAARPRTEPSAAVGGVDAPRQPLARREQQEARADQALPYEDTLAALADELRPAELAAGAVRTGFLGVQPEDAAHWLDAELRTLPDLELLRVDVGPGSAVAGALPRLPVVRLVYEDAAGHRFILIQQFVADWNLDADLSAPVITMDPSGQTTYRWINRGYRLMLSSQVSSDSLRALAERVR